MPASSPFRTLLREIRKRAGLSQPELAAYLNLSSPTISKIETGREKPPLDSAFYQRLRTVPGFTDADITLLLQAREADRATEDLRELLAQALGKFVAPDQQYDIECLTEVTADLPEELQPFSELLSEASTKILTSSYIESLTLLPERGSAAIVQAFSPIPEAPPTTLEEEVEERQEPSPESFTDTGDSGIISPPMPHEVVEHGDHLTEHVSELQSQAKLGSETNQRPRHYPHENVVVHVAQLQAEAQRREESPAGSGIIYERGRLTTVAGASRVSGVKVGTLRNLLSDGKLTERGRIKAPGGGKVLIDLDELDSLPRRPVGRPKKSPKSLSGSRPRGRPRKTP